MIRCGLGTALTVRSEPILTVVVQGKGRKLTGKSISDEDYAKDSVQAVVWIEWDEEFDTGQ